MSITEIKPCTMTDGRCTTYAPGHNLHFIHASHIGRSPWGWRDAILRSTENNVMMIDYLERGSITVWHHRALPIDAGTPVRVHERLRALAFRGAWFQLSIRSGGIGPVPEPEHPELWSQEMQAGIVSNAEGTGLEIAPE